MHPKKNIAPYKTDLNFMRTICGSKYRIAKSTSEDLYNDENLMPWERKAYQKIDLNELYIFCVFLPTQNFSIFI
jgi:hypothetical protein